MSVPQTLAAVLATVAGLIAIAIDRMSENGRDDALILSGLAGAVTVGFAVLVFASVLPRAKKRGGGAPAIALITSIVGFFSVASAWTGLPFVLGTGGVMLGTATRRGADKPEQRALAGLAVGLGAAAVVLGCVAVTLGSESIL